MKDRQRYLAVLAVAIIFLTTVVEAATIDVGPGQGVQAVINRANTGDTIVVHSGVYRESLNITRSIILEGRGHPLLDGSSVGDAITLRADGARVSGFDIRTVRQTGIHILSRNNTVENNTISGCQDGIRLDRSSSNNISYNDINNNTNGITLYASEENTIEHNNIRDNNINEASDCGIFLVYSSNNIIRKNDLMDNGDCSVSLRSSSYNAIIGNNVTKNDWYGISLTESSNRNLIADNNASGNTNAGIYLDSSRQNLIRGNRAEHNVRGVYLSYDSNDNTLEGNNVSNNEKGLNLANHSSNNTLADNTAKDNGYGIYLSFSSGWDLVYGNHLINNDCNAYDVGQNNRWDNGSVGNYYSDLGRIFYVPGGPSVDRHPFSEVPGA
jgi:parallel beta-helix repeat protein